MNNEELILKKLEKLDTLSIAVDKVVADNVIMKADLAEVKGDVKEVKTKVEHIESNLEYLAPKVQKCEDEGLLNAHRILALEEASKVQG